MNDENQATMISLIRELDKKLAVVDTKLQLISQRLDADAGEKGDLKSEVKEIKSEQDSIKETVTTLKAQMRVGVSVAGVVLVAVVALVFKAFAA